MWLSSDHLCSVIKMSKHTHARAPKNTPSQTGERMNVRRLECAVHVVILFY